MNTGRATSESLKAVLTRIHLILTPASPTGDIGKLASRIRMLIENSGLYFEKRLETAIRNLTRESTASTAGNLAAQPAIRKIFIKDLNVTFFVETAETKAMIDSARFQVETALLETFETVAVRVVVNEKKIEQFSQANAANRGGRQVDLNI